MASVFEREENAYTLAVQAGLWGYPLAHRVEAFPKALSVQGIGLNSLHNFPGLKTAEDRFVVTPNNLTIDAYGIVDVSRGPVVMYVPHLRAPRWFIVQLGDAFDDVVFNVGGTKAAMPGAYLLTGPEFAGRVPVEMTEIRMRTKIGFVDVRIAVSGTADLPNAVEEQRGFSLVPRTGREGSGRSMPMWPERPPLDETRRNRRWWIGRNGNGGSRRSGATAAGDSDRESGSRRVGHRGRRDAGRRGHRRVGARVWLMF